MTSVGDIVSFTDGLAELIDRRLGDSRPRVVIGGQFYDLDVATRQYACEVQQFAPGGFQSCIQTDFWSRTSR